MAKNARSTVFRVTGLPLGKAEGDTESQLSEKISDLLKNDGQEDVQAIISCVPSCDDEQTSSALVEFKGGMPKFLSQLEYDPLDNWQVEMGDDDINFDQHFFGFTQLYSTAPEKPVAAEYSSS